MIGKLKNQQLSTWVTTYISMGCLQNPQEMHDCCSRKDDQTTENLKDYKGKVYFTPGNHDWNAGKVGGLKHVKEQEKFIEEFLKQKDAFIPDQGCPGPEVKNLDKDVILLAMDSQWWLHPHKDKDEFDDCKNRNSHDIIQELKDRLDQYDDKFIVLTFHHPLFSNGEHNGHYGLKEMIFPLAELSDNLYIPLPGIGFLYPFYRTAFGAKQDLPHPLYQKFKKEILLALRGYENVIVASGHEHNLQYTVNGENHHIVSGSGSKSTKLRKDKNAIYASENKGYARIKFFKDGSVDLEFITIGDKKANISFSKEIIKRPLIAPKKVDQYDLSSKTVVDKASEIYNTSSFHQSLFGKTNRKDWNTEVEVRNLNLSTEHGGLVPIKKGGGFSSNSLRLKAPDKHQYVLRSVQKGVVKVVPPQFRGTFVQAIFQDQISASQPYAALAVPALAKAAGVYYTNPEIVYLEKQEALGDFNDIFANAMYLFEERPSGNREGEESFGDSKKIVGYNDVLQALRKSEKARINQKQVLKSRLFDVLLGDWDRHDDQWRWASFEKVENGKKLTYYEPIPRDRDQVFFGYKGFVPFLTKVLSPELRKLSYFDYKIKNIKYLGFNARYFDRHFLNEMTRSDWISAAQEIQTNVTNEAIADGMNSLPEPIRVTKGQEYTSKLLQRRKDLVGYANELYDYISTYVNVPGTDKKDHFDILRHADNSTDVMVYDINSENERTRLRYSRKFQSDETKEIRIYALGGKDKIHVSGDQTKGSLLRIIGGKGNDQIIDISSVRGSKKKTKIYDTKLSKDSKLGKEAKFLPITDPSENDFDRKEFNYDATISLPLLAYNVDDGFIVSNSFSTKKYGWRKTPYAVSHGLLVSYATASQEFNLSYHGEVIDAVGKADFLLGVDLSLPSDRDNFFGLSNDRNVAISDIEDFNEYRYEQQKFRISPALQFSSINRLHKFSINAYYEYSNLNENAGKIISDLPIFEDEEDGNNFLGLGTSYVLHKVDNEVSPSTGMDFKLYTKYNFDIGNTSDFNFFDIDGHLTLYNFIPLPRPFVWATHIRGGIIFGDFSFYQGHYLGQDNNLRGYRENRIGGKSSFVWSNDLRIMLFKVKGKVIPFTFGIIGSYDYGRVWNDGEVSAEGWHKSVGGGFWISPFDLGNISFYFMNVPETDEFPHKETTFSFQFGFPF